MARNDGCSEVARLTVRIPKEIHEDVIACAALKNKPVNKLILELLSDTVGKMTTSNPNAPMGTPCEADVKVVQAEKGMYMFRLGDRKDCFSTWNELLKAIDQLPNRGYIYRRGKELSSVMSIVNFKLDRDFNRKPLRYRDFIVWKKGFSDYLPKLRKNLRKSGPSQLVSFRIHTEILDIIIQIAEEYSIIAGKQCGISHILRNVIYRSLQTLDLDKPDLSPVPLAIRRVQKRLSEEDVSEVVVQHDEEENSRKNPPGASPAGNKTNTPAH